MPIWSFDARIDFVPDADCLDQFPPVGKEYFDKYAYRDVRLGKYVICGDDARFINHSDTPNLVETSAIGQDHGIDMASREIRKGEELTCNYRTFDSDFGRKLKPSQPYAL